MTFGKEVIHQVENQLSYLRCNKVISEYSLQNSSILFNYNFYFIFAKFDILIINNLITIIIYRLNAKKILIRKLTNMLIW